MELSTKLQQLSESATVSLADRVRRLKAAGRDIIALQTGDPDWPTPEPIIEAAYRALRDGWTHYASSRGLPELREAIATWLQNEFAVGYDPGSEILVTSGGVHAYFCALQAILNPGDEVLVPDPTWMTHVNVVSLVGGRAVRVPGRAENQFFPTRDAWEAALTPKTTAMVINSPSNPTGAVADEPYLRDLVQFAEAHDLYIISDEVYHAIVFDGCKHVSVASLPGARERCLLVNSLSKTYAMTGWRIGYLAAPGRVICEALKASQYSITNVAPFVQLAAVCALTDPRVEEFVHRMVGSYRRRRDLALQLLQNAGRGSVRANGPRGAFYLFADVRESGLDSLTVAERLLEEAGVAAVPGSVYGQGGEGFLRITTAVSDEVVQEGTARIVSWASRI